MQRIEDFSIPLAYTVACCLTLAIVGAMVLAVSIAAAYPVPFCISVFVLPLIALHRRINFYGLIGMAALGLSAALSIVIIKQLVDLFIRVLL